MYKKKRRSRANRQLAECEYAQQLARSYIKKVIRIHRRETSLKACAQGAIGTTIKKTVERG